MRRFLRGADQSPLPARSPRLPASGPAASPAGPVVVSVVVPVYRHWDLIPDLLAALAAQDLGAERIEVVLVDDGASVPAPVPPPGIRIVRGPGRGSYAARNAGARAARGTRLVFTDADCRPRPGWLSAFLRADRAAPGHLLAGPVTSVPAGPGRPNRWEIFDIVRGIPQGRYVAHGYAATANLSVPAAAFHALGGFDGARRSGGDAEFCRRARRAGHGLRLVPDAVVEHLARADLASLAQKARRVTGGQVASGTAGRRLAWMLRTLAPPLREMAIYARADHPRRWRLQAAGVRLRLWGVEIAETARLLAGKPPER